MNIRKLFIGALGTTALFMGIAGPANAAVCANAVNASVLGDADQDNDCSTNVETPDATVPTP